MPHQELSAEQANRDAHDAVRQASPWLERFGRVGYVARGVVYALSGMLAAQAALSGGETTGTQGALRELVQAPCSSIIPLAIANPKPDPLAG